MQAGKLRHNINILQPPALTAGAFGTQPPASSSFTVFAKGIWASIEPIRANEMGFAMSFAATVSHKLRIRYLAGVSPVMQVKFGTRTFFINGSVNFEERNIYLDMYCTEVVA